MSFPLQQMRPVRSFRAVQHLPDRARVSVAPVVECRQRPVAANLDQPLHGVVEREVQAEKIGAHAGAVDGKRRASLGNGDGLAILGRDRLANAFGAGADTQNHRHPNHSNPSHSSLPVRRHLGTFDGQHKRRSSAAEIDTYLRAESRAMREYREGLLHIAASLTVTTALIFVSALILGVI